MIDCGLSAATGGSSCGYRYRPAGSASVIPHSSDVLSRVRCHILLRLHCRQDGPGRQVMTLHLDSSGLSSKNFAAS